MADPLTMALIAGGTSALGFGLNTISSSMASKRNMKYAMRLASYQDKLNRQYTRDYYSLSRESLEKADYNPLLAVSSGNSAQGSIYSTNAPATDSSTGTDAVNSALDVMRLKNDTKLAESQSENSQSNSALAQEQAQTEKQKRLNMVVDQAKTEAETDLLKKDSSWYDKKADAEILNKIEQAKSFQANSAIGMLNADTQYQNMVNNYKLGVESNNIKKYEAETNRGKNSVSGSGLGFSFSRSGYSSGYSKIQAKPYQAHNFRLKEKYRKGL